MSRTRWIIGTGRPRLAAVGLIATLVLAACGGSSSPTPTGATGATPGPVDSVAPSQTEAPPPGETPGDAITPADGTEAFSAATTALDALDSYAFRVEIQSTSTDTGATTTSHTVMSGVVVNKPEKASSLLMEDLDADVTNTSAIVLIGGDAWVGGGRDDWTAIPAAQAEAFIPAMEVFRPEQMFGTYFLGIAGNFGSVGSESKNGIDCTHYQGDESVGTLLGAIAGFAGNWHSDVWIANDGGFLVHSEAGAEAAAGADAGSFLIVVDITDPNSAGPVEPPA